MAIMLPKLDEAADFHCISIRPFLGPQRGSHVS